MLFTALLAGAVVVPALPAVAASETIDVRDNSFSPTKVGVDVGDTITWKWDGSNAHNVTVKKGPQKFKSKTQSKGSYARTMKKPGKYTIYCTLHSGMDMKVQVAKAPPATTTSTTRPTP
jgi:plastocyanin